MILFKDFQQRHLKIQLNRAYLYIKWPYLSDRFIKYVIMGLCFLICKAF